MNAGPEYVRDISATILDESQRVIINEDFHADDAMHWAVSVSAGVGSLAVITTDADSFSGGGSMRMRINPGAAPQQWVYADMPVLGLQGVGRIRYWCRYRVEEAAANWNTYQIRLTRYDGTNLNMALVRMLSNAAAATEWDYTNAAGAWVEIPELDDYFRMADGVWLELEMIVDFENLVLESVTMFDTRVQLDVPLYTAADASVPYTNIRAEWSANGAADRDALVDRIVVEEL